MGRVKTMLGKERADRGNGEVGLLSRVDKIEVLGINVGRKRGHA